MDGYDEALRLIAREREERTGELDLGCLGLTEVPSELFTLQDLECLNLGYRYRGRDGKVRWSRNNGPENTIRDLPAELGGLLQLKYLGLAWTQIADLTPLAQLTCLESLNCAGTQVNDLTPLASLTSLQSLNCVHTQVNDLTPLASLTSLQSLKCVHTQVNDLTPLARLTALQSLDCSDTQVNDLTPLGSLTSLQSLYCGGTQANDLTPLAHLTSLQVLDCGHTRVNDLTSLLALPALRALRASGCPLRDLPRALVFKPSLEELSLAHTPIPGIPPEVLSKDHSDDCLPRLRAHFTDLDAGSEPVREAKLLVLGNGRVGKTQICRTLRGLHYDDGVPSTHGITVTREPWTGAAPGETLNIWDFGGQDIYHGTHALFMKTRAVFLVAWHPDFEERHEETVDGTLFRNFPLTYWLEYVRTLGGAHSPVVVVQTRCDHPRHEVPHLPVEKRLLTFASLKPCWHSAKEARGQAALEDALRDALRTLQERESLVTIGAGRRRVWSRLDEWHAQDQQRPRHERQHRVLTRAEFERLCAEAGGVSSAGHLLEYLHNVGVVFHRRELFEDRIILDQSWALDALYAVFERQTSHRLLVSQGGRFTRELLAALVWREYSAGEQRLFLSLMESCGIAFVHRPADERLGLEAEYIAPELLPDRAGVEHELAGRWDASGETRRMEYEYPFLHAGLMRSLLCDIGEHARQAGVFWRDGAWMYEQASGCRALVEQKPSGERGGRIVVQVQGARPGRLAQWLRNRIAERSALFGFPDPRPVIDDFDFDFAQGPAAGRAHAPAAAGARDAARDETPPPAFGKLPLSAYPARGPQVFVSYAWDDETPEGRRRGQLVDNLRTALRSQGIEVLYDRDEMRPGDRISEFMERLTEGDAILAVISDKYLRSPFCMYELFRVYQRCGADPARFLGKVIPLILPDARLATVEERLDYASFWDDRLVKLEARVKNRPATVGVEAFRQFKLIGEFARNTSDILEYLTDKLQPRDFDRQAEQGFEEILKQLPGRKP